jgi:hypothetical protein
VSGTPTCAATPTTAPTSPVEAWRTPTPQTLGTIFTEESKPYEVEIVVAEVGRRSGAPTSCTGCTFDGSVADERAFVAMGGSAELTRVRDLQSAGAPGLADRGVAAWPSACSAETGRGTGLVSTDQLEVAVLDRTGRGAPSDGSPAQRLSELLLASGRRETPMIGPWSPTTHRRWATRHQPADTAPTDGDGGE